MARFVEPVTARDGGVQVALHLCKIVGGPVDARHALPVGRPGIATNESAAGEPAGNVVVAGARAARGVALRTAEAATDVVCQQGIHAGPGAKLLLNAPLADREFVDGRGKASVDAAFATIEVRPPPGRLGGQPCMKRRSKADAIPEGRVRVPGIDALLGMVNRVAGHLMPEAGHVRPIVPRAGIAGPLRIARPEPVVVFPRRVGRRRRRRGIRGNMIRRFVDLPRVHVVGHHDPMSGTDGVERIGGHHIAKLLAPDVCVVGLRQQARVAVVNGVRDSNRTPGAIVAAEAQGRRMTMTPAQDLIGGPRGGLDEPRGARHRRRQHCSHPRSPVRSHQGSRRAALVPGPTRHRFTDTPRIGWAR